MSYRLDLDKASFETADDYARAFVERWIEWQRKFEAFGESFNIKFNPMPANIEDLRSAGGSTSKDDENMFDKVKRLLGYGESCLNGGIQLTSGFCRCPEHYYGRLCETIECLNNGTRSSVNTCLCDEPLYIRGQFCEYIDCQNSGAPMHGEGRCKCLENWYTGRFCEQYTAPWLYIFLGIGIALILLIVFCVLCRLRQYKKEVNAFNDQRYHDRNRRRNDLPARYGQPGQPGQLVGRQTNGVQRPPPRLSRTDQIHRQAMLQLHLNENGEQEMRLVPPPGLHQASHVQVPPAYSVVPLSDGRRSDQALTSTGQFAHGLDKPGTPPPTYDQVMNEAHLYPMDWRRQGQQEDV